MFLAAFNRSNGSREDLVEHLVLVQGTKAPHPDRETLFRRKDANILWMKHSSHVSGIQNAEGCGRARWAMDADRRGQRI